MESDPRFHRNDKVWIEPEKEGEERLHGELDSWDDKYKCWIVRIYIPGDACDNWTGYRASVEYLTLDEEFGRKRVTDEIQEFHEKAHVGRLKEGYGCDCSGLMMLIEGGQYMSQDTVPCGEKQPVISHRHLGSIHNPLPYVPERNPWPKPHGRPTITQEEAERRFQGSTKVIATHYVAESIPDNDLYLVGTKLYWDCPYTGTAWWHDGRWLWQPDGDDTAFYVVGPWSTGLGNDTKVEEAWEKAR